ncbi:MAG TPA: calcium-binding protein [Thermoleophilaceae bacterium]|jgi:Ca2+-binding RTX toxin-like protein|nr:calcium-binding protein [Thermoleophilaceae bacterium]
MRRFLILLTAVCAIAAVPASAHAGTLSVSGGVLSYTETDASARNVVTVNLSPDGSRITVSDSGRSGTRALTLQSDGSCVVSRATGNCPAAGVTSIAVNTTDQDDTITLNAAIPGRLQGGNGNDKVAGGPADDVLIGDAGADTLSGGAGRDTADYSARTAPVSVSLNGAADDGEAGEKDNVANDVEILAGGSGDDQLVGNDGDNVLLGNAGNDMLAGGAGNDQLDGGAGDDMLAGGAGADTLTGGDGNDTASYAASTAGVQVALDGKPGDGAPAENDNVDTENVIGSPADDVLIGNAGANAVTGGDGNDRLLGGKGPDNLDGGPGDDIIQSLDGVKDNVACGDGEDGVVSDRRDVRVGCDYIKYRPLAATSTALHVSNGSVRAPVRCSPATAVGCHGRISIKVGRKTLGTLVYRLTSGRRWVAKIKLNRRGRAYVGKRRVIKASLALRDVDAAGVANRTTQTIRIGH